jgi:hypothetical protein
LFTVSDYLIAPGTAREAPSPGLAHTSVRSIPDPFSIHGL